MINKRKLIERYRPRSRSIQSDREAVIQVENSVEAYVELQKPKGFTSLAITIEPLLFSLTFIQKFSQGVLLNLLERNVCVQKYNLTSIECTYEKNENATMKHYLENSAAEVNLAIQLIQGLCPVALSMFVGPWSDKNGRKPFIMLPFAGYFIYYLLWGVISLYPHVPIKYMLIPSVPLSLTGGTVSILVCCYCYICDIFDVDSRTFRFNFAMSAFLAGDLLANLIVYRVFEAAGEYGYPLVFFISAMVAALSFLYAWTCLKESIIKIEGHGFIFSWTNAKSVVTVLFIRPRGELIILSLTIFLLVLEVVLKYGESSLEFLVGKSQFSWNLNHYTMFSSYNTVIAVASSVLGSIILKKIFHCENITIILLSAVSLTVAEVLRAFSKNEHIYWFFSGLTKTGALVGPTIGAEMSTIVSIEDLGKVYAFNALVESGSAYLSTPMYTALYKHLLSSQDILHVFFLSAGISSMIVLSTVFLFYQNKRYKQDSFQVSGIK